MEIQLLVRAQEALQAGYSDRWVVERERECEILQSAVETAIDDRASHLIYICGPPGTGKTSTVKHLLEKIVDDHKNVLSNSEHFMINAGSINSVKSFLSSLCNALSLPSADNAAAYKKFTNYDFSQALTYIFKKHATLGVYGILVIDEVDRLSTLSIGGRGKASTVDRLLLTLWTAIQDRPLCMIAMANALTLGASLQRQLKKIGGEEAVTCLPFAAFTESAMLAVLEARLSVAKEDYAMELSADRGSCAELGISFRMAKKTRIANIRKRLDQITLIDPTAMKLMCKRISTGSGDCRALLNVARAHISLRLSKFKADITPRGATPVIERLSCTTGVAVPDFPLTTPQIECKKRVSDTTTPKDMVQLRSPDKQRRVSDVSIENVIINSDEMPTAAPSTAGSSPIGHVTLQETQQLLNAAAFSGTPPVVQLVQALPLDQQLLLLAICRREDSWLSLVSVRNALKTVCETHGLKSSLLSSPILLSGSLSALSSAGLIREVRKRKVSGIELCLAPHEMDQVLFHVRKSFRHISNMDG